MALIFIKKRREPIEIEYTRAKKIKDLRFGDINGNGKGAPLETVNLGDEWAGELGQISAVELYQKDKSEASREKQEQYIVIDNKKRCIIEQPFLFVDQAKECARRCKKKGLDVTLEKRFI